LRSTVAVLRGRHRGRTGWIYGELGRQPRGVTKVHVFFGDRFTGAIAVVPIANLESRTQAELPLAPPSKSTGERKRP
jgi:hypothetical protein